MKKIITSILIVISLIITLSGCGNPTLPTEREEWHGIKYSNIQLAYFIHSDDNTPPIFFETAKKAEKLVREWWNNDETFIIPEDIFPCSFSEEAGDLRGFQENNCLFIKKDLSESDLLATIVHEMIHLQNHSGLLYTDGVGRGLMEGFIETATVKIVGNDTDATSNYLFFQDCPKLRENYNLFEQCYKENGDVETFYANFFETSKKEAKKIVNILDNFENLPAEFDFNAEEYYNFLSQRLGINIEDLEE